MKTINIKNWFAERRIDEVEAIIPDMTGIARGKLIPAGKYEEETGMRLPESVFMQTVTGDYPEDEIYDEILDPAEIDVILKPDLNTLTVVPWATDPTALLIHDAYYSDNSPVTVSPRHVLKKVINLFSQEGLKPVVAPEVEFYLVKKNKDSDYPLEPPVGRSGRPEAGRQSFSIDAMNEFDPYIEDVYHYCEEMGISAETLIHEAGVAQLEVNLVHGDPLRLADEVFLFKRVVREAALKHNIYATFMSKPMENEPGSAMHIHQSIMNIETDTNIFSNEDGSPSKMFYYYLGGLQKYLPLAMCLFAPNVNSYRRITKYFSTPVNVEWAVDNRTVGLRIPHSNAANRRIENRVAGSDANSYIAMAATLACGYLGMKEKIEPTEPTQGSAYDMPYAFPRNLEEAIHKLRQCKELKEVLGEDFVNAYAAVKEQEYATFLTVISSWEREHLLLSV